MNQLPDDHASCLSHLAPLSSAPHTTRLIVEAIRRAGERRAGIRSSLVHRIVPFANFRWPSALDIGQRRDDFGISQHILVNWHVAVIALKSCQFPHAKLGY